MDQLYGNVAAHFNKSGLLHMFIAQYIKVFRPFPRLEKSHLVAAEVRRALIIAVMIVSEFTSCL